MGFGILQISDFHLKEADASRLTNRISAVVAALRTRIAASEGLLLVLGGDLSDSGQKSEFDKVKVFVSTLVESLKRELKIEVLGPVIVPGNHDCDLIHEDDVRPSLLASLQGELNTLKLDGHKVEQIVAVQDEFFSFEEGYSGSHRKGSSRLYYSHRFSLGKLSILVHCFNTAWVSKIKEAQGQIVFPNQIKPAVPEERPTVSLSVFHHPYRWFDPGNGRQFQRSVEQISDVVMTGHEHDGDHFRRKSREGPEVAYVEGAAFDAKGLETGFNFITIDPEERSYEVTKFLRNDSVYHPSQTNRTEFIRNPQLGIYHFENNPAFERELMQLGAAFSHAAKPNLEMDDIFVYPDLKVRSFLDKKGRLVESEGVPNFIARERLVNVAGAPMSGKTTFAKKLYRDLHDRNKYVPVLVNGEDITGKPGTALRNSSDRAFRRQYSDEYVEAYRQLPPERKALIIDDWHMARLNASGKRAYMVAAAREFAIVVTLGADQSWFQEVLESSVGTETAQPFQFCDIREFGHRLRGKLITKWHRLGGEFELEEAQITQRVAVSENTLNTVIGKGLFPSYPFFVLYALHISSAQKQQTIAHGSYGHVYEAFLTMRLAAVSEKATDVGTKYTYLSLIASEMFSKGRMYLSDAEFADVHRRFEQEYDLRISDEQMLGQLRDARILGPVHEQVGFLHKYCYYYFVANHFKKVLANDRDAQSAREMLRQMADTVHDEEYMNILIFYIYLTEDRQVIEYFVERSRSFFSEYQLCDFQRDVEFIADLLQPRKLEVNSKRIDENRDGFRSQKDRAEDADKDEEPVVRTKYDDSLEDGLKLDFAFHALQVMGQVLRNFPGDLKADIKYQLTEESYRLGLRTMKSFLVMLETNLDEIRGVIENFVLLYRAKAGEDARREAGQIVAYLAEAAIFTMIKRISFSVGLEDLRETYMAVRKAFGETNLPVRLIDLSIRLDHFSKLPMSDIEDLEKTALSIVPYNILLMLVTERLHLFPADYKDRQRISDLFKVNTTRTLLGDKKLKR